MARKKSADLEKTKNVLLETGMLLLQEKGYHATGIQQIADAAGVPKGSFYNYFSSKEEFGAAVIRYYTASSSGKWLALLQEATQQQGSYQALTAAFLAVTEKYRCSTLKKGCLLGTLAAEISEASEECRVAMIESIAQFRSILARHLQDGQASGQVRSDVDAQQLADLVWDCWQGSLLRMKVEQSVETVEQDLNMLFTRLLIVK